jgi:D-alanyl-D-alanine carboxypeptidase
MPARSIILPVLLAALLPAGAEAQMKTEATAEPAIPDTPAGRQFALWLEAFNRGDSQELAEWMRTQYPTSNVPAEALSGLRAMTGGFEPVHFEESGEGRIVVLLAEREWAGSFARISMDVEPQVGGKVTGVQLQGAAPPPDYPPIARLSEAEALAALEAKLKKFASEGRFSGAARVSRRGEPVFDFVSGDADREQGIANTLDTQFRIGSMNKMFTAVAVLQLVEAGKVELDAPIGTYLPDYPNANLAAQVTVRHLLTHTGGTGDIFGPEFFERRTELCEPGDYLALYGSRDLEFAPGERFSYSNYGFVLLGAIIEAVTGASYYDYVDAHIYAPSGMVASGSLPESTNVAARAIGYTGQGSPDGQPRPNTDTLPCRGSPAGGGYSTVGDLARFAEALQSGKLLSPEMLRQATSEQIGMGPVAAYGFGFGTSANNGTKTFGHSGGAPGMSADLTVLPELGYDVAIAANMDSQLVSRLAQYVAARLPGRE